MIYIIESMVENGNTADIEKEVASLEDADEIAYVYLISDVPHGAMYHDGVSLKKRRVYEQIMNMCRFFATFSYFSVYQQNYFIIKAFFFAYIL